MRSLMISAGIALALSTTGALAANNAITEADAGYQMIMVLPGIGYSQLDCYENMMAQNAIDEVIALHDAAIASTDNGSIHYVLEIQRSQINLEAKLAQHSANTSGCPATGG